MNRKHKKIISDQEAFFNQHSYPESEVIVNSLFHDYANKEQVETLSWLADKKKILDYGVGTGTSINVFLKGRDPRKYHIYGVDIAGKAIERAKKKYPFYSFYKITNNNIPQIKNNSMEGAYMLHVLHHAHDHEAIFKETYAKLGKSGKYVINDLCSNNPFNRLARKLFVSMPSFVKKRFSDDLVVGESIPEKYKVDVEKVIRSLKKVGFSIEEVGYGHLFFFLFGWIDRFIPFSKLPIFPSFYKKLMALEAYLLKYDFFQRKAEVFYIKCRKN